MNIFWAATSTYISKFSTSFTVNSISIKVKRNFWHQNINIYYLDSLHNRLGSISKMVLVTYINYKCVFRDKYNVLFW